ncbi:MAG: hypothetical protein WCX74_02785 [Candidatus Paceibacterota bacterium]
MDNQVTDPFIMLQNATSAQDVVYSYMLATMYSSREQLKALLIMIKDRKISNEDWKIIGEWCTKLGLSDLEIMIMQIPI